MIVEVPMDKWLRGQGAGEGKFLNSDGCRCVLGFVLKAHDVPDRALIGRGSILELIGVEVPKLFDTVTGQFHIATRVATEITSVNDNRSTTDDQKIDRLSEMLGPIGYDLVFTKAGSYADV